LHATIIQKKMSRTAIVLGASGLIGGELLPLLLANDGFTSVKSLGRRTIDIYHSKLQQFIVDFYDIKSLEQYVAGADVIFCAIGTTQAKVNGDDKAYKKVDFDIPVNTATAASKFNLQSFIMVSSIGADAGSNNFYLKLKGVTEEAIIKLPIPQVCIMRPSLLLGNRKEKRFGEKMAQIFMPLAAPLMLGNATKYKPIQAKEVAKAMLALAIQNKKGISIYEYENIKKLAQTLV
jgi:uncharacterized protein YbjT (DUF2867 family)